MDIECIVPVLKVIQVNHVRVALVAFSVNQRKKVNTVNLANVLVTSIQKKKALVIPLAVNV